MGGTIRTAVWLAQDLVQQQSLEMAVETGTVAVTDDVIDEVDVTEQERMVSTITIRLKRKAFG